MCRNLWSVPKNTVIFGFRRFQKSGRSSLILVVIVRYIHIGYRLKLGKNCTETIILVDFHLISRLKMVITEIDFPHKFSALLPSFYLALHTERDMEAFHIPDLKMSSESVSE